MAIQFTKMSGSGNDFVIIDNRKPIINDSKKVDFVKRVCDRKMSVGADGVIFVENSDNADIKWDFYNDDGSSAEMCGNGGRCVARYAAEKKITSNELTLETVAGIIAAKVDGVNEVVDITNHSEGENPYYSGEPVTQSGGSCGSGCGCSSEASGGGDCGC